jgi:nitrogenase molybdenum-iron protein alpha/beta subunit
VGLSGTEAWLRRVGEGLGTKKSVIESAAREGRVQAGPDMKTLAGTARRKLKGRRSVIFADTPLAAGLASFATEAGLPPIMVGLRDESLGGREAFLRLLKESGTEPPRDLTVLGNPPLADARRRIAELAKDGCLGLLFGSNYESPEPARAGARIPVIETGFPCVGWHAAAASPSLGFAGAACLAKRILGQIRSVSE